MDLSALAPQLNTTDVSSLQKTIEQHEMQAGMRNYSQMVGTCFGSCIGDFTSAKMAEKEVNSVTLNSMRKKGKRRGRER